MAIMSRRKNIVGSRASKFKGKTAQMTARQMFLDRIMQLPDDEEERKRKESRRR